MNGPNEATYADNKISRIPIYPASHPQLASSRSSRLNRKILCKNKIHHLTDSTTCLFPIVGSLDPTSHPTVFKPPRLSTLIDKLTDQNLPGVNHDAILPS